MKEGGPVPPKLVAALLVIMLIIARAAQPPVTLDWAAIGRACGRPSAAQLDLMTLTHCKERRVGDSLPPDFMSDPTRCRGALERLLELDGRAKVASDQHASLLLRYDCGQNYSIQFDCEDCKLAYRRWICSEMVPFYGENGGLVRPCIRFCHDVEQRCPYLVPDQTLITSGDLAHPTAQYAGEPNFLCVDPNIARLDPNSTSGDEDCCYTHFHNFCTTSTTSGSKTSTSTSSSSGRIVTSSAMALASYLGARALVSIT